MSQEELTRTIHSTYQCSSFPELGLLVVRFRGAFEEKSAVRWWKRVAGSIDSRSVSKRLLDVRGLTASATEVGKALSGMTVEGQLGRDRIVFLVEGELPAALMDAIEAYVADMESHEWMVTDTLAAASAFLGLDLELVSRGLKEMEDWKTL